jgi:taurine dioxygenase
MEHVMAAAFTVNKLSDNGAAEVIEVDWSKIVEPETFTALKQTFLENPILVIRNTKLTPKQQIAFSRQLGLLEHNDTRRDLTHPDDSDVLILSNEIKADGKAVGVVDAGEEWHSDLSYQPAPAFATILQLIKRPSRGGDTEFCNLYNVYEALSEDLKERVRGRNGIHHLSKLRNSRVRISTDRPGAGEYFARVNEDQFGSTHPMVRTHPETGRQALFISPRFTIGIEGMDDSEAQPLLDKLFAFMEDKRFHYLHKWQDDDLVMWDNRCLNHRACGGYTLDDLRRLHRTCVRGDRSFYRAAA